MSSDPHHYSQDPQLPPVRKSNGLLIVAAVLGVVGLVSVCACCGAGFWLVNFGMSVVSADIENQLRDDPQIQEHIGTIQSLEVDWVKSMAEEDDSTFTYDIRGDKGSGELIVNSVSDDDGGEVIQSATLRMSTGETIELRLE